MSEISNLVGQRIRFFRKERELSQETLAFKAGINVSYLGQIERGVKSPTVDSLEKVAKALDVSLEEIFRFSTSLPERSPKPAMDKITYQLSNRSEAEQEAVHELIRIFLHLKDGQ